MKRREEKIALICCATHTVSAKRSPVINTIHHPLKGVQPKSELLKPCFRSTSCFSQCYSTMAHLPGSGQWPCSHLIQCIAFRPRAYPSCFLSRLSLRQQPCLGSSVLCRRPCLFVEHVFTSSFRSSRAFVLVQHLLHGVNLGVQLIMCIRSFGPSSSVGLDEVDLHTSCLPSSQFQVPLRAP